jgi:hypothetical protein
VREVEWTGEFEEGGFDEAEWAGVEARDAGRGAGTAIIDRVPPASASDSGRRCRPGGAASSPDAGLG